MHVFCVFFKVIKSPVLSIFIINSSTRERHVTTHQRSGQYTSTKYNPVIIYINSKLKQGLMKYINNMLSLFLCTANCVYSITMTIATNPNTVLTSGRSTVHVESWLILKKYTQKFNMYMYKMARIGIICINIIFQHLILSILSLLKRMYD